MFLSSAGLLVCCLYAYLILSIFLRLFVHSFIYLFVFMCVFFLHEKDFGATWVREWHNTGNYQSWLIAMEVYKQENGFRISHVRMAGHCCRGSLKVSLLNIFLRERECHLFLFFFLIVRFFFFFLFFFFWRNKETNKSTKSASNAYVHPTQVSDLGLRITQHIDPQKTEALKKAVVSGGKVCLSSCFGHYSSSIFLAFQYYTHTLPCSLSLIHTHTHTLSLSLTRALFFLFLSQTLQGCERSRV